MTWDCLSPILSHCGALGKFAESLEGYELQKGRAQNPYLGAENTGWSQKRWV